MKSALDIYKNHLPRLANEFVYYAQCNPNKYKVVTRISNGVEVKVYKKPFNTLIFEYDFDELRLEDELKVLKFSNNNHEYQIFSWKDQSNYFVYNEDGSRVLKQTLMGNKYEEKVEYCHEDFVRIYGYFLKDQGFYENENTLF